MALCQHLGPALRRGHHHGAVDADHPHGDVARLRQALHVDPVERVDGQAGDLHDDQADQQHQRRAAGEAARPEPKRHARSTVAAST